MYAAPPRKQLSQGDIFQAVPITEMSGTSVSEWRGRIIVLSHDCEIAKPSCTAPLVARLRESHEFPLDKWGLIRENRLYNGMHLERDNSLAEGFVDFRFIHRARCEVLDACRKIASLDDNGRDALTYFLWRFFSRSQALGPALSGF